MRAFVSLRSWRLRRPALGLFALALGATALPAQGRLTSPKDFLGFNIGDDYRLANYTQFEQYWKKLDGESDKMLVQEIGKTAEGRPQLMAIITSPENFKKLDRYKEIARRLATAEGLTDEQARALAKEGRCIVWVDGGLHATEVLGAHQLLETSYQLVSRTDEETQRFLNDCIILAVHANPDGMELVSNWYMQEADTLKRTYNSIPRLYQKYIGHDNNRDFYMLNQPESINIARIQYHEWYPQIVYNHHQTGPAGTVMFAPPFRDPFNYNFDPLIPLGVDMVGASMHNRFAVEGKPGVTMRSGASYSTWWNGGLRTTVYFHNMIGLLTETIGSPTPMQLPLVVNNQLPRGDLPYPIAPQRWHFRQSVDYSVTANYAVFDVASRQRENLLFNIYRMGKNSIERGRRDNWTMTPTVIEAVNAQVAKDRTTQEAVRSSGRDRQEQLLMAAIMPRGGAVDAKYYEMMRDPKNRDARGYVLPSSQPDFQTATKFVNALRKVNVAVHRATGAFTAGGKQYPAGSYVVKTAQAFRPHVLDMFEPQVHPNDFAYPGGPPRAPYDNAGYTLAYTMGVKFDRIVDGFDCPCQAIEGMATPVAATVADAAGAKGYLIAAAANDAFVAVNRALKAGAPAYRLTSPTRVGSHSFQPGAFYIAASPATKAIVDKAASELGLAISGTTAAPGDAQRINPKRIALWDQYGGSMPSGHTRWLLEQFEFPFDVVYPQSLDAGNLKAKYDVLIFMGGAIPASDRPPTTFMGFGGQPKPEDVPASFRPTLGRVTIAKTVPELKKFLNEGGTVITIGTSTNLAYHLDLPIKDQMVERTPTGEERELPREKFYVPGSVLRVAVDNTAPSALGMGTEADVMFDDSPVFRLEPNAAMQGVRPVAWFASDKPLRSGWAWGQTYLEGGVAVAEAQVGKGKLYLFGPEITFRGQPHGTFKFLFNSILAGDDNGRMRTPATAVQP